jgi:hypothetical protein
LNTVPAKRRKPKGEYVDVAEVIEGFSASVIAGEHRRRNYGEQRLRVVRREWQNCSDYLRFVYTTLNGKGECEEQGASYAGNTGRVL